MKVWKKTAMFGLGLVAAVTLAACGSGGASKKQDMYQKS